MEYTNTKFKIFKRLALVLAVLYFLYASINTIYVLESTGELIVNSQGSSITVSINKGSQFTLPNGVYRVRLASGTYKIYASKNGMQQVKTVNIINKQTTNISISLTLSNQQSTQKAIIAEENRLIKILPFTGPNFEWQTSYNYTFTNNQAIPQIIINSTSQTGINDAMVWLKDSGYNITGFNIKTNIVNTVE